MQFKHLLETWNHEITIICIKYAKNHCKICQTFLTIMKMKLSSDVNKHVLPPLEIVFWTTILRTSKLFFWKFLIPSLLRPSFLQRFLGPKKSIGHFLRDWKSSGRETGEESRRISCVLGLQLKWPAMRRSTFSGRVTPTKRSADPASLMWGSMIK